MEPGLGGQGWGAGTCTIEVKMVTEGKVVSQASLEKEGTKCEVDPPEAHESLGSCFGHFEKTPGPAHIQAHKTQGNKEGSLTLWFTG